MPLTYEEAAEIRTFSGWCCKTCRRFYGDDSTAEHTARWCCAPDHPCECGGRAEKGYICCGECRAKHKVEQYAKRERRPWDGKQMLWADAWGDRYFRDPEEFFEYIADEYDDDDPESHADDWIRDARIVLCDPVKARTFDLRDYLCDELADDGEPPPGWEEVEAAVNKFLVDAGTLSWCPGKYAWDGKVCDGFTFL